MTPDTDTREPMEGLASYLRVEANMVTGENERTLRRWAAEVEAIRSAPVLAGELHGRLMALADNYASEHAYAEAECFTSQSDKAEAERSREKVRDKLNEALRPICALAATPAKDSAPVQAVVTDERIDGLLHKLDAIAREYDRRDYGLPTFTDPEMTNMRAAVRAFQSPAAPLEVQPSAARDVLAERQRQIEKEGWGATHDDEHEEGDLARAGAAYVLAHSDIPVLTKFRIADRPIWPWSIAWWKPKSYRKNLVRAGALILAEIERLDRAAIKGEGRQQ